MSFKPDLKEYFYLKGSFRQIYNTRDVTQYRSEKSLDQRISNCFFFPNLFQKYFEFREPSCYNSSTCKPLTLCPLSENPRLVFHGFQKAYLDHFGKHRSRPSCPRLPGYTGRSRPAWLHCNLLRHLRQPTDLCPLPHCHCPLPIYVFTFQC